MVFSGAGIIIGSVVVIAVLFLGFLCWFCRSAERKMAPIGTVKYKKHHKKIHGFKRGSFGSGSYYPPGGWSSDIGHSSSDEEAGRCGDSGHDSGGHDSGGHDSGGHDSGGGCDSGGGGDSGGGCDSGGGGGDSGGGRCDSGGGGGD